MEGPKFVLVLSEIKTGGKRAGASLGLPATKHLHDLEGCHADSRPQSELSGETEGNREGN